MAGGKVETVLSYLVLTLFALAVMLPVGWLLLAAMSPKANAGVDLADVRFSNFADAWVQADFGLHLLNSLIICVGAVVLTSVVSILAGYGLTILAMPGARIVFPIILAGIMIPLEGILVPLYYNLRSVGLTSSLLGLVLAHTGLGISFGVFWMRATLRAIPRELIESAELDGAGRLRMLWTIVLPVIRPALITMILLMFMWTWNDYFLAFVLVNDETKMPVTLALGSFSTRYTQQLNLMAAAAVLVALPVLILYMFFQRQFIQGVMSGALKG
jgi:raffinose/stachyose/melibiose transport system permease protein